MNFLYEKKIEYGMCDTKSFLKLGEIFKIVEAAVASYFKSHEVDNFTVKERYNAVWLFLKTKIAVKTFPMWDEDVRVSARRVTHDSKLTCIIEIMISKKDDTPSIVGWVECCVADIFTRKLLRLSSVSFSIPEETQMPSFFEKWEFKDLEEIETIDVRSSHIDYSKHTNNAEYIRMIMDTYSVDELEALKIEEVEIHYLAESKERDRLVILKNENNFRIMRDKPIMEMRIIQKGETK